MMMRHCDMMAMTMTDLAVFIRDCPIGTVDDDYNLGLAGSVWMERFGAYPTVGDIRVIAGEKYE